MTCLTFLFFFFICAEADGQQQGMSKLSSSLDQARMLETPSVSATSGGESENLDFWEKHESLLLAAWQEWFQENKQDLPNLNEIQMMIDPYFREGIDALWNAPTEGKEQFLKQHFFKEPLQGVFTSTQFFSPTGIRRIRRHLTAAMHAKIPTRRPNGMNRFGLVMDSETQGGVSYLQLDEFREWLVDDYIRPLGRMLFPEYIGSTDDESSYAFSIHYSVTANDSNSSDVKLEEHSDASVVTMNINLNLPEDGEYSGSELVFLDDDQRMHEVELQPGMVVIHRGLHRHLAKEIATGTRHQLIIWLFGKDGYVRFAPYEKEEQMSVEERWGDRSRQKDRNSKGHNIMEL